MSVVGLLGMLSIIISMMIIYTKYYSLNVKTLPVGVSRIKPEHQQDYSACVYPMIASSLVFLFLLAASFITLINDTCKSKQLTVWNRDSMGFTFQHLILTTASIVFLILLRSYIFAKEKVNWAPDEQYGDMNFFQVCIPIYVVIALFFIKVACFHVEQLWFKLVVALCCFVTSVSISTYFDANHFNDASILRVGLPISVALALQAVHDVVFYT